MNLALLIFDCQGVIIEAPNAIAAIGAKAKALQSLALPYGEQACEYIALLHALYPHAHCGELFTELMERDASFLLNPKKIEAIVQQFPRAYQEAEYNIPLLAGILSVFEKWHDRIPLHVCSSMPQEALRNLLTQRKLDAYLAGMHGTPPSKYQQVHNCVMQSRADPAEIVMVGDTVADFDIAQSLGIAFYGCGHCIADTQHASLHDMTQFSTRHASLHDMTQFSTRHASLHDMTQFSTRHASLHDMTQFSTRHASSYDMTQFSAWLEHKYPSYK